LIMLGIDHKIASQYSDQIVPIDLELVKYIESITSSADQDASATYH
jgi:hypothetical protein